MPMSEDQHRKVHQKARDGLARMTLRKLRRMRDRYLGSPRAFRFDKQIRAFKSLIEEITPEKYKALDAAQQQGALRGAQRWCERPEDVSWQRQTGRCARADEQSRGASKGNGRGRREL